MAIVNFIGESKVKELGNLSESVEAKRIQTAIQDVQNDNLLSILGTRLYNDIKARIVAGTVGSGSPSYSGLLENYIWPCMIKYIEAELQVFNTYQSTNKGTQTKSETNARPASMDELIDIEARLRDKAELRAQTLINHLWANRETYPVFNTETGCDEVRPKKTSAYQCGICLD